MMCKSADGLISKVVLRVYSGTGRTQIASIEDIKIPGAAGTMAARVYNPKPSAAGKLPALIFIHGGGWCLCSIETHDNICRDLAHQADIIVISVEYRLAPEHKFPAGLEDCYTALKWIHNNADSLKVDPARLAIGGEHIYSASSV